MTHPTDHPWSLVKGMEPVSFCDWSGRISLVLFLATCNLRCPTCHNSDLVLRPGSLPQIPREKVLQTLQDKSHWLDGIVVTGGEPTVVPGLESLLSELTGLGFEIKLDSNGFYPELIERLLEQELVRHVAVDVKGPFSKYPRLTGGMAQQDQARANLERIFHLARREPDSFSFRCTWVPGLSEEDIAEARNYLPGTHRLELQKYREPKIAVDEKDRSATMFGDTLKA